MSTKKYIQSSTFMNVFYLSVSATSLHGPFSPAIRQGGISSVKLASFLHAGIRS